MSTDQINKTKVIDLVEQYPKHYNRMIKKDQGLCQWVIDNSPEVDNFNERIYIAIYGEPDTMPCGKLPKFNTMIKGYFQFCGNKKVCECARNAHSSTIGDTIRNKSSTEKEVTLTRRNNTMMEKYGVTNAMHSTEIKNKLSETVQSKYGVSSPFASKEVQEKIKATNNERHGVDYPAMNPDIMAKTIKTQIETQGSIMGKARAVLDDMFIDGNPFNHSEIQDAIREKRRSTHGTEHVLQRHMPESTLAVLNDPVECEKFIKGKTRIQAASELGVWYGTISRAAYKYGIADLFLQGQQNTELERMVATLLDEIGISYDVGRTDLIKPYELDFYIPSHDLAIEVGSLFWHSELNAGRGRDYHKKKWDMCLSKGIRLLQWFDDELYGNWDVIANKIRYELGAINNKIGARKCTVGLLTDTKQERKFLDANHIQGFSGDRSHVLGAWYNNELVAIMTFANRSNQYELARFSTALGATYQGLFSKMMSYFTKNIRDPKISSIVSFSNSMHGYGNLYSSTGFELEHVVAPSYYYTKDYHSRLLRYQFMKHKLVEKYGESVSDLTEWEIMQQEGYDRVWDCGKVKWKMELD